MSLEFAYYPGCAAKQVQKEAASSAEAVAKILGITLKPMPRATCCGAVSLRESKPAFSLAVAARILTEAEAMGHDLCTICNTCLQTLNYANYRFKHEPEILEQINGVLKKAGVRPYEATIKVHHLLWVVTEQVDPQVLQSKVKKPLNGMNVAPFYGCHSQRPGEIFEARKGENVDQLDQLIRAIGGNSVQYDGKDKCCGFHVMLSDKNEMRTMVGQNCLDAKDSGAEMMISPCTLCDMAMGAYQGPAEKVMGKSIDLPEMNFAQLLGIALGVDDATLGMARLHVDPVPALKKRNI
ncbi:MAG: CoB--CoM heterodisulfide reductase iron-sulfur subunit B family protein [Magnetococcales bacterium]|nr:CoB--CoM heterodisulfide reductase iron-sulfur subunit B family protein [Magnetococcales bacterium]